MRKKKILFVNYSLHSGGIEKSLVTALSLFDYDRFSVDLQLFANEGMFFPQIPEKVNVLPPLFPPEYRLNIRQAFFTLLKKGRPLLALCRLRVSLAGRRGTVGERMRKMWRAERRLIRPAAGSYDAVIAYMEGQPLYYAVERVDSPIKVGFIHGDYIAMGLSPDFERPFIGALSALCTVSESCLSALKKVFPEYSGRFHVIYNIISPSFLRSMAEKGRGFDDGFDGPLVLSIARLSKQKGLDIALPAVWALKEKGVRFRWYIIGVGPEEEALKASVREMGLEDSICFLGEQANPYPFLRQCDVYMQPSRFEGKAIAVDEAMVLCRPILLTDFSTAADQITSGENGMIVPMTPEGVEDGLSRLLGDPVLRERFSGELSRLDLSNEREIEKLYALLEGKGRG